MVKIIIGICLDRRLVIDALQDKGKEISRSMGDLGICRDWF